MVPATPSNQQRVGAARSDARRHAPRAGGRRILPIGIWCLLIAMSCGMRRLGTKMATLVLSCRYRGKDTHTHGAVRLPLGGVGGRSAAVFPPLSGPPTAQRSTYRSAVIPPLSGHPTAQRSPNRSAATPPLSGYPTALSLGWERGSPSALSARSAFGPTHSASALCASKQKFRFHQPGAGWGGVAGRTACAAAAGHGELPLDDGRAGHDDDGGFWPTGGPDLG